MKNRQWRFGSLTFSCSFICLSWFLHLTFASDPQSGGSHYRKASSSDGSSDSQYDRPEAGRSTSSNSNNMKGLWLVIPALIIFVLLYIACKNGCSSNVDETRYEQPIIQPYNVPDNNRHSQYSTTGGGQSTYPLVTDAQGSNSYPMGPILPGPYGILPPVPRGNIRNAPHSDLLPPLPQRYASNISNADEDSVPMTPPPSYESVVNR